VRLSNDRAGIVVVVVVVATVVVVAAVAAIVAAVSLNIRNKRKLGLEIMMNCHGVMALFTKFSLTV